jgi:hypothetical protein
MVELDVARRLVCQFPSHEIVDSKLDSLFWGDADQLWKYTGIETLETLILNDLLGAIDRILVQDMADAGTPLILHPGFH